MANVEWIFQRPFWSDPDYLSDLLTVGKVCARKTRTELHDINFGFGYSSSATGKHPNVEVWCGAASLEPLQNGVAPLVFLFHGSGFKPFGGKHLWKQYTGHEVGCLRWGEFNDANVPLRLCYNKVSERVISLGRIPRDNPDLLNRLIALEVPSSKEAEFQKSRDEIGRESAERWKRIAGFSELIRTLQGSVCAVCECDIREGLQGAHILEVQDKGIETPENGLCLCYQHHAYWDKGLFIISHDDGKNRLVVDLPGHSAHSLEKLGITKHELASSLNVPERVRMLKERSKAREKRQRPPPSTPSI